VSEPPRLGVSPFEADDETTHFPPSLRGKPLHFVAKVPLHFVAKVPVNS